MQKKEKSLNKINRDMFKLYVFLIGICIVLESVFVVFSYYNTKKQLMTEAEANAEELAASIQAELHKGYETIELFKDLYNVYGDVFLQDFNKICEELSKDNLAIGSMYFAPKGIIKYSYPDKVDSATSDFEMIKDPIQGPKAQKAITDRKATVAGPHNLIEGGQGFIIRNPIFRGDEFIAFTIIVMDKDRLLKQISSNVHRGKYNFAIWKETDPTSITDKEGYILTHFEGTNKIQRNVKHSFDVLNDTWHITLEPVGGWNIWKAMKSQLIISLLIFMFLSVLFYAHILAAGHKRKLQMEIFANNAKSSFLFSMSHDIRTPMNAIIGFADLMRKNLDDKEKLTDYLNKLHASSSFLLSLINNVLEMARIESGKMTLEENVINVQTFEDVTDAVFTDLARNKGLTFSNEYKFSSEYVVGDEMKIRELTLNVVSNAIKYTPAGGFVKLTLLEEPCDKPGYTMFTAIAEDSGIGISKEYLPHIFEEFSRERSSTDSKVAGTGLGMPIVKKLIDKMDGSITIDSKEGKGTKVTIKLPLRIASAEQIEAARLAEAQNESLKKIPDLQDMATDAANTTGSAITTRMHIIKNSQAQLALQNKRILLAEDNDLNSEIATALLEEIGFVVERAVDGLQCVKKIEEQPANYYDLVLMDIQMPNMNGFKATATIRSMKNGQKAQIPIIAMTANAFDEDRQKSLESGMNGHVAKPINVADLLKAITRVISID